MTILIAFTASANRRYWLSGVSLMLGGFLMAAAGCGSHDCSSKPTREVASSETECPSGECTTGDCCSTVSRAALLTNASAASDTAQAIGLKVVKFESFQKDVKAHAGKVVCAYQWSEASAPSKKNLPVLLELQRKLGKDGVVFLTVSSDPKKASKEALQALETAKCDLVNYQQDENDTVDGWTSCFGCCGFPALVVFGRDGKKAATFDVTELPFNPGEIEKTVVKLLNVK